MRLSLRTRLGCGIAGAVLFASLAPAPAAQATTPKVALMYGDSLTWESRFVVTQQLTAKGWTPNVHSFGYTAPCDWLTWMPADIARYQPSTIGILTAGNTLGPVTTCMFETPYSTAYFAKYQADLDAFFVAAHASGARVVFFAAPPFLDKARNAAAISINSTARNLAHTHPGVSYSNAVRTALSVNGRYVTNKACLATETAAQGCANGTIPIRTVAGYADAGLHLCPSGLGANAPLGVCPTYSSGEFRFGRSVANGLANPPRPFIP